MLASGSAHHLRFRILLLWVKNILRISGKRIPVVVISLPTLDNSFSPTLVQGRMVVDGEKYEGVGPREYPRRSGVVRVRPGSVERV